MDDICGGAVNFYEGEMVSVLVFLMVVQGGMVLAATRERMAQCSMRHVAQGSTSRGLSGG